MKTFECVLSSWSNVLIFHINWGYTFLPPNLKYRDFQVTKINEKLIWDLEEEMVMFWLGGFIYQIYCACLSASKVHIIFSIWLFGNKFDLCKSWWLFNRISFAQYDIVLARAFVYMRKIIVCNSKLGITCT